MSERPDTPLPEPLPEWVADHPVARELGPEPPEDLVAYRSDDTVQPPGTEDETSFSDGGVV